MLENKSAASTTGGNTTTADRIYRTMRDSITTAEMKPGDRLVHRQLAQQFGTSNIPVVEALRRLESDGLVVSYPNAGAQVRVWTEHDIRGAFLAREALEGVTCRMFAEYASPIEKTKLVEYGRRFDEACQAGEYERARKIDIQLHLHIAKSGYSAAGTTVLYKLVENSYLLAATISNACIDAKLPRETAGPIGVHDELIAALNSGDPDLAEKAGKQHVRTSMEDVMQIWAQNDEAI